jgi:hypothetical protein
MALMDRRDRVKLGLKLQDAWGYFDTILGGDTFAGHKSSKLRSKLRFYKTGHQYLLEATDMLPEADRAHAHALNLPNYDDLDDERDLNKHARVGREIANDIGKRYKVDPRTSELVGESADLRRPRRRSRRSSRR